MASETEICNRALQHVGATRITSIDDSGSKSARECKVAFAPVRDALLRTYPWSFAIARASLAADTAVPVFDPPIYQYSFPTSALRILLPTDSDLDWIVEGRKILSSWTAPLEVRYIKRVTDPNEMDALFLEAFALKLGLAICEPITGSNTKKAAIGQEFKELVATARQVGGIEKMAQELPEDTWITVRG